MTSERDERQGLAPDDARFLERLRSHYTRAAPSDARRAAFDARLRERLEARHRRPWVPALAAAGAAAVLVWVTTDLGPSAPSPVGPERVAARTPATNAWTERLFHADLSAHAVADEDEGSELPPDYEAIEVVLLEG
jgi:hypothetical protein